MTKKLDDMLKDSPTHPIRLSWFRLLRENLSHAAIIYRKYPASSDLWHCHDGYYEMVLVLAGKAVNETATGQYQIGRGDIFVMPPESIHHYVSMDGFQHYIILIKPDIFENFPGKFHNVPNFRSLFHEGTSPSPILHLEEKLLPGIAAKIEAAQAEYMNRSPGWLEAFYGEFFCTLISILRPAQSSRHQSDRTENQIRKTIRYMEKKLQEEHTLQSLSAVAQMSPSNFRMQFRALTGYSPIDYLIRLRLKQAAMLMLYTDLRFSEIMSLVGFSDSSYFTRQFRSVLGKTPRDFRSAVKAGTITPPEETARILPAWDAED